MRNCVKYKNSKERSRRKITIINSLYEEKVHECDGKWGRQGQMFRGGINTVLSNYHQFLHNNNKKHESESSSRYY